HFKSKEKYKIPAAWLIEKSGFTKGFRYKGVGISENHSLALVNYEGTSEQIKELSSEIINTVKDKFHILLHPEPEIFNI
ncbi:MAG TPA: UDP-N-acetylenolpyruvoylglucosamine reductase, partial [Bacteroidetes bacterium]|nr:UDP-N-acetylenolpyruvoylglucosamine reductase [Bacteroidota bacterium]